MEQILDKRTRVYKESQKQLQQTINETLPDIVPPIEGQKTKLAVTQPWNSKGQNIGRQPWRTDMLMLKRKNPGFRCRFVDPKNIERREMRGYRIANATDYGGKTDTKVLSDGSNMGTTLTRCGMVLMEIPEDIVQQQEQQQEARIKATMRDAKTRVRQQAVEVGNEIGHAVSVFDESKEER